MSRKAAITRLRSLVTHEMRDRASRLTRARLQSIDEQGRVSISVGGLVREASIAFKCTRAEMAAALQEGCDVLVGFLDDEDGRPVVLGLLHDVVRDTVRDASVDGAPAPYEVDSAGGIILRAGEATIRLHADGRLELRGLEIVSIAEGCQRILGGTVSIN